jgi:hypothetical protein
MSSEPSTPPSAGSRSLPDDLRSDVLDIISDAVLWRLPKAHWADIEELVQALHDAPQTGGLKAVDLPYVPQEAISGIGGIVPMPRATVISGY